MRREVDGRKAGMGDFAESSSLEKDADVMMAITHNTVDIGGAAREQSSISVLKSRDGKIGECPVLFQRARLIFKEIT
jgi:replicative DNA helicase